MSGIAKSCASSKGSHEPGAEKEVDAEVDDVDECREVDEVAKEEVEERRVVMVAVEPGIGGIEPSYPTRSRNAWADTTNSSSKQSNACES